MTATECTTVDVCVPTFRRESLADTLRSLAAQGLPPGVRMRVIVADNDDTPSAKRRATAEAARLGLDLLYLHCPARNISVARNGALAAARAEWLAFIDDDECARPGWLAALLARAAEGDVDAVLGPVVPVYRPDAPRWMRDGRVHATEPLIRSGRVAAGYTSNALLRRTAAAGQTFPVELGRSGGEDTEFFARLLRRGLRIGHAPQAVVTEAVPPERARMGWLLRRRYRAGQTHGALLAAEAGGGARRIAPAALALAKAGYCLGAAAVTAPSPGRRAFWTLRAALHAGVVSRLAGHAEIEQYGSPEPAPHAPPANPPGARPP